MVKLLLWALTVAVSAAWYNVLIKTVSERLSFLFWVECFTGIVMTVCFYLKHLEEGLSFAAVSHRVAFLASINIPFYLLVVIFLLGQVLLKVHMFERHPLAKIIPILELGTPLTTFFYVLLGDPLSLTAGIGIGLISMGAMLSGFKRLYFPNIFKPLFHLPASLYISGISMAVMGTAENIATYIATENNVQTNGLLTLLEKINPFSLLHFKFVTPLEYFGITTIFFVFSFFLFLICFKNYSLKSLWANLIAHPKTIFVATVANTLSQYVYYYIYTGDEQSIIVALTRFSIPLTLAFAYLTFKEKIHVPEKVGVTLIIAGGILATL